MLLVLVVLILVLGFGGWYVGPGVGHYGGFGLGGILLIVLLVLLLTGRL